MDDTDQSGDGFFASLSGVDAEDAFYRCKERLLLWRDEVESLKEKLGQTPRADKQAAHEIRQDILRAESKLRRIRPVIANYRATLDKREAHGLWVEGVRAVCGHDVLHEVYDWMSAEKKRRNREARDSAES